MSNENQDQNTEKAQNVENIDSPHNSTDLQDNSIMDMGNLLRSLFTQATNLESQHQKGLERKRNEQDEHSDNTSHNNESQSGMFDEEYRWETLGNLIQSHKKLCKAFLMLLKERDTDE